MTMNEFITKYPPVGSKWEISIGPTVPRTKVVVIYSGHGTVAVKQIGGKYTIAIDILAWYRLYNPVAI
jgi:hypothetical protein